MRKNNLGPNSVADKASEVAGKLEPEVKEGPLGLPYVKPRGAPDLPDPTNSRQSPFNGY